ncbi:CGNR zinc finger domain-containing protein [Nonomuraea sp. NBC_01738]|uniref:CGNR zinc finger domain-containing protein n=1 Tax=Nonomuraea sp. NBC_01738 TaxID=2976003 RepID=UPI002E147FF1|nr:CGNR zinc finger domain-containing protein [Nonomuraea sp. NBC_01738]
MREYRETGLVALDLVNTWDEYLDEPERLPDVAALAAFCAEFAIPGEPTARDLVEAREVRTRLRDVLEAQDRTAALGEWLGDLPLTPTIMAAAGGVPVLAVTPSSRTLPSTLAAQAVNDLVALAAAGEWDRVRLCAATPCRDAFVDRSRPGRRLFCSTRCANRSHATASRARHRG